MTPVERFHNNLSLIATFFEDPQERVSSIAFRALEDIENLFSSHLYKQISDPNLLSNAIEILTEKCEKQRRKVSCSDTFLFTRLKEVRGCILQRQIKLGKSLYECKTGDFTAHPSFSESISYERHPILSLPKGKGADTFLEKYNTAEKRRNLLIEHIEEVYSTLFPNGVFAFPKERVSTKCFPKTFGWYMGARDNESDVLLEEMGRIAKENGIAFISSLEDPSQVPKMINCEYFDEHVSAFVQDYMDFTPSSLQFIASNPTREHAETSEAEAFATALVKERRDRCKFWEQYKGSELLDVLGAPFYSPHWKKSVFLSESAGVPVSMTLSHCEGGNTLLGEDEEGPYAVIGLDSYFATKYLLNRILGRDPTSEEIEKAFAIDYGIPVERLYFIEQPGDFHLDMHLAIVGGKTILLNDAEKAFTIFKDERMQYRRERQEEIEVQIIDCEKELRKYQRLGRVTEEEVALRENIQKLRQDFGVLLKSERHLSEKAKSLAQFENLVETQLHEHGFTVIRIPGRYDYEEEVPAMNFFNMVTAVTPEGKNLVVTLGCESEKYERLFQEAIQASGRPDVSIYFLPLKDSQECLSLKAGISCRVKTIPDSSRNTVPLIEANLR